jgi:hypothetical protein
MDYHADGTKYDSRCNCDEVCDVSLRAADAQIREAAAKDPAYAQVLIEIFEEDAFAVEAMRDESSRIARQSWNILGEDGHHEYLSTGCLHGEHEYCKSMTGLAGAKRPAECKFCKAPCICGCHKDTSVIEGGIAT